ncbi:hypothetical protein RRG08_051071 [Elysia crispata]|uniref:Uncharacterized protein n=1 Tax=Elysia crispata TaxID=231223 RepID=A0AAE0YSJ3_9GAST|nr:hypothetical protein RRG08_051071 [Elysia crispata]
MGFEFFIERTSTFPRWRRPCEAFVKATVLMFTSTILLSPIQMDLTMETSGALKLLQELLEAEEDNEDVTEGDCEEYNNAVASVPSSLVPKTIIASLISRANSVLSNKECERADSSMSDDDGDDPDYVPSTNTSLLTENDWQDKSSDKRAYYKAICTLH